MKRARTRKQDGSEAMKDRSPVRSRMLVGIVCALLGAGVLRAEYKAMEIVRVPVDRLVANNEKAAAADPQDSASRLRLARLHAMAYALRVAEVDVVAEAKEIGPPWTGHEAKVIPFTPAPSADEAQEKAARAHLAKSVARYKEVLELQPENLVARLGYAWVSDQAGDKDTAMREYRAVIDKAWAEEGKMETGKLGGRYLTVEAAEYLIPLLDRTRDDAEIRTLRDRIRKLNALPRPITPVAVPLRDGLRPADLIDESARVRFDLDGSGLVREWAWITPDAAWLVWDPQGTGAIRSGLQLFGNVTFWLPWSDGYEAMRALDDDGDGVLASRELAGLALWQDRNRNGVAEAGEVKPLAAWGITALGVRAEQSADGTWCCARGAIRADGACRSTYDVISTGSPLRR